MTCLKCGGQKFSEENTRFALKVKGEEIETIVPAFVCGSCGEPLMNDEHMNAFRKAAADEYRRRKGLLTSEEIIQYRKQLKEND